MPMSPNSRVAQAGFTLLELVVVMVLLGLVSSMTLPAMQRWHAGLVARSEASAIVESLQAAAFEAGVQRRSLLMDDASFTPQTAADPAAASSAVAQTARVQIQLPTGWQVVRTVPAIFGGDGLCKPGLAALQSASGTAMLFLVHGPLCRVDWVLDHSTGGRTNTSS